MMKLCNFVLKFHKKVYEKYSLKKLMETGDSEQNLFQTSTGFNVSTQRKSNRTMFTVKYILSYVSLVQTHPKPGPALILCPYHMEVNANWSLDFILYVKLKDVWG